MTGMVAGGCLLAWMLLYVPVSSAGGEAPVSNRTALFLGTGASRASATVILKDVQGLWGGRNIFVTGNGTVTVQIVERGMKEKRYRFAMEGKANQQLLARFIDNDYCTISPETRMGQPDEARPAITLVNSAGKAHTVEKWANDRHARFDALYEAILELEKFCVNHDPVYEGAYDSSYRPDGTK